MTTTHRARPGRVAELNLSYATIVASSCLSLVAAFVLSLDALALAADPSAGLGCDLNTVVSCSTVASAWQSSLLGFPNAFIGLATEPIMITVGVAGLGGVRFPRWFMSVMQFGYLAGLLFAYWLFFQAVFVIGALCPWCLLVTVSTTVVFASLTRINIRESNLMVPHRVRSLLQVAVDARLDVMVLMICLLGLTLLVVTRYGGALFA